MPRTNLITGLDIGSGTIKILVAKKNKEGLEVVSKIEEPANGIRRGVVVDVEGVSNILKNAFSRLREETGQKIDGVYLSVNGGHLFSQPSHGIISVSRADQRISEEDISRVLQAAQTFSLPSNKEIFDVFPKEFIVDGEKGIKEPLGLQGVRLEVEVLALGGFSPYLKNLTQAVLDSNLQILDMVPSPIASARAVLTEKQKELGGAILDIGAGTSGLAVFEEGNLIHLTVLPIGSSNITNDIAIGLKCDIEVAERIKIEFGSCILKDGKKREKIKLADEEILVFSQKQLTNIISARVSEIFREVNKELKKIGKEKLLPAGIVLTGGGAKLPKITELAKKEFHLLCKLGKIKGIDGLEEDPYLATLAGLVLLGNDWEREEKIPAFSGDFVSKLKRIFKIFIP
jgi:cell division protein FtsA